MPPSSTASLWEALRGVGLEGHRALWTPESRLELRDLATGTSLDRPLKDLRDRSVLISTTNQLAAALALLELDGIARRLVICPPDLDPMHLPYVISTAQVDAIVTDHDDDALNELDVECLAHCTRELRRTDVDRASDVETEWILFTSGTTGVPKMVVHTLATLTGAITLSGNLAGPIVWATFYDIRRYGGLQILLRALLGGGSLLLSAPGEPVVTFLMRARECCVTHITGTPSHWRRALMTSEARSISPRYARLSGEIADQSIIDHLQATFPNAGVAHAFASTEAGVAFEVSDGCAGFPASFIGRNDSGVELAIKNETLRIRSLRTALRYVGDTAESLLDLDGFVDTGDVVECRDNRYFFVGRRGGIINVGGLKIHPEEVEAVINRHPRVRMSLVTARKNPITGAVVAADVVLVDNDVGKTDPSSLESIKAEIRGACRSFLSAHKVPAVIRIVSSLPVTASGKLGRRDA